MTAVWFDSASGVFLRYEGRSGLPGAPKTVIQLLRAGERGAVGP